MQRMNSQHVRTTAFKTLRRTGDLPLLALILPGVFQHMPPEFVQFELITQVGAYIEEGDAFRTQHPLMTIRHDKIRVASLDIKIQGPEALDGIDAVENLLVVAMFTQCVQIHAQTAGILHRANRE